MQYLNFTFKGKPEWLAILSVYLFEDGFEGIEEQGMQMQAYIKDSATAFELSNEVAGFVRLHKINYEVNSINDINWNAQWESSFEPINVENKCLIRANHHPTVDNIEFDILIQPKMTFGTGHHPTTFLMVKQMLDLELENKTIFDFGTGTGILAILAEKMGASHVFANDIDPNCAENTAENISLNNCTKIEFALGDIDLINGRQYDIILANVTRNTILERFVQLYEALNVNGYLLLSGFYKSDLQYFTEAAEKLDFSIVNVEEKDNWLVIVLKK